jgi:hypothetical protein
MESKLTDHVLEIGELLAWYSATHIANTLWMLVPVVIYAQGPARCPLIAPYKYAISYTLEDRAGFAQLINVYRAASDGEGRSSPAEVQSVGWSQSWANPTPTVSVLR